MNLDGMKTRAHPLPAMSPADVARFLSYVKRESDPGACWVWAAARSKGYGAFRLGGRIVWAHRVALAVANGRDPYPFVVDHLCHVPACCNPSHLRLATDKQNGENRRGAMRRSSHGVRGVTASGEKWVVKVGHLGRRYYGGTFATIAEADAAAVALRARLYTPIGGAP